MIAHLINVLTLVLAAFAIQNSMLRVEWQLTILPTSSE